MVFTKRKEDQSEKLFEDFIANLRKEGFDIKVFDKGKIKTRLGKGMYKAWERALSILTYRKILIIFKEKELEASWPSYDYLDRLAINFAKAPNGESLKKAEEELFQIEPELFKELSS